MARAETPVPAVQPDLQVVEVAAPMVRQEAVPVAAVPVAAVAEARNATTRTAQQMNTTTIVILVLAVIGALVVLTGVL
jgi:hypothetical protein